MKRPRELLKINRLHGCLLLLVTPLNVTFFSFDWSGFALDPEIWRARFIHQRFPIHTGKRQERLPRLYPTVPQWLSSCHGNTRFNGGSYSFIYGFMDSSSMHPSLSDHIRRLNIPRDKGGLPSLLLHDLEEEKSDLDRLRASRIPGIFSNYNTCVVHFMMVQFHISCVF